MSTSNPNPSKLRWGTAFEAFTATWHYRSELLQLSWFWLLLILPIMGTLDWILYPWTSNSEGSALVSIGTAMVPQMVGMFAGASVAVAWHRLIINGENPTSDVYFRVDATVIKYFIAAVIIVILFTLPVAIGIGIFGGPVSEIAAAPEPASPLPMDTNASSLTCFVCLLIAAPLITFALAIISYLPTRFALILPAIALGHKDTSLAKSWNATRRNYIRIFFGTMISGLAVCAFSLLPWLITGIENPTRWTSALTTIFGTVLGFTLGMVSITFISLTYSQLLGHDHSALPSDTEV
ncbi:MAG: hypothetical protein HOO99_09045 [Hyphomicrobiaceae bacterium]|nr:hypothetical protein [Hyphomicrobiaceae bacterium]